MVHTEVTVSKKQMKDYIYIIFQDDGFLAVDFGGKMPICDYPLKCLCDRFQTLLGHCDGNVSSFCPQNNQMQYEHKDSCTQWLVMWFLVVLRCFKWSYMVLRVFPSRVFFDSHILQIVFRRMVHLNNDAVQKQGEESLGSTMAPMVPMALRGCGFFRVFLFVCSACWSCWCSQATLVKMG